MERLQAKLRETEDVINEISLYNETESIPELIGNCIFQVTPEDCADKYEDRSEQLERQEAIQRMEVDSLLQEMHRLETLLEARHGLDFKR